MLCLGEDDFFLTVKRLSAGANMLALDLSSSVISCGTLNVLLYFAVHHFSFLCYTCIINMLWGLNRQYNKDNLNCSWHIVRQYIGFFLLFPSLFTTHLHSMHNFTNICLFQAWDKRPRKKDDFICRHIIFKHLFH